MGKGVNIVSASSFKKYSHTIEILFEQGHISITSQRQGEKIGVI